MAATKRSYPAIPANLWWSLRERFHNAPPKGDVTKDYLKTALGAPEKVAANAWPSIKLVGFVDENNRLTPRALKWRDDQTYAEACREIIDEIYPDSLKDVSHPDDPDLAAAQRWFLNETGAGAARARVLATFYALVAKGELVPAGDRAAKPVTPRTTRRESADAQSSGTRTKTERKNGSTKEPTPIEPAMPSLSVAIQVYIDKGMDPTQIDKVFESMARHLYGRK